MVSAAKPLLFPSPLPPPNPPLDLCQDSDADEQKLTETSQEFEHIEITNGYYKGKKPDSLYLYVCARIYMHTHTCAHRDFTADGKTMLFSGQLRLLGSLRREASDPYQCSAFLHQLP